MIKQKIKKQYFSKKFSLILIIALLICMTGCFNPRPYKYEGEYPELYSVAINTLLGADGYDLGEIRHPAKIELLEEDEYGRKLFLYNEGTRVSEFSIIVLQKSDNKYSYYYPDYNFLSAPEEALVMDGIDELKIINDWSMPIDEHKCVKTEIVREKVKGPISSDTLEPRYYKTLGKDAYSNADAHIKFLTSDEHGRSIYLCYGEGEVSEHVHNISGRYIVMLFQPDGSIDESAGIFELTDIYDYQDELKDFKTANGWNRPVN